MQSLSVCMMVQNVEKTLAIALESLGNAYDELVIVDGGSTDKTCKIAESYGARVIHSSWSGNHSQQRNIYLREINTEWVFVIDSDEFIDKSTVDFLLAIKHQGCSSNIDNFWIPRKWINPFNLKHYISSYPHFPDFQRRLFRYHKDISYSGIIHESIEGLKSSGKYQADLSIYHLDLFINSEEKRQEKVRKYMKVSPLNGAIHAYLPVFKNLNFSEWDYQSVLPGVQTLLENLNISSVAASELNSLIPGEIKDDEFYETIKDIARKEDIKTVLEIGSSAGAGSTEAFVSGLQENPNKPILFCMEVSKPRFFELQKKYIKSFYFVKCYNISSVSLEHFPNENEVIKFYCTKQTNLNFYPLERVLGWLRQDIEYVKHSGVNGEGIKHIKEENNIDLFDVVLIDGSEFTGSIELEEVYGAKFIILDDTNTFKNFNNYQKLLRDDNYELLKSNNRIRNGYAVFKIKNQRQQDISLNKANTLQQELPIHFLTIVLNGEPFIRYHIEIFKQLPFRWHWHIVEGVADLKHDTAWSLQLGGRVPDRVHQHGRSSDGTSEYLDELMRMYPENVTVYRKPEGIFWDGKREMVNEPLISSIREECLLWQVDADELWTVEQLCTARQMFVENPEKTAALYWCWYFVGENLVISSRNCYTQNPQQEWLRTWKFRPGCVWAAHEPPTLAEPLPKGQWRDVATVNPFLHEETEKQALVFQHFAYATLEQIQFKEQYYGYSNLVSQWKALQQQTKFPILLRQYFPWIQDATMVDRAESCGVVPISRKELNSSDWQFIQPDNSDSQIVRIQKPSPIIIIDGVFFQLYRTGIARVWRSLLEEWAEMDFAKQIIVLDRVGSSPAIHGIKYRLVPAYNYSQTDADREMLQQVCDEEEADLFISTYYTTPISTPSIFMAYDMIPEVLGANFNEPMWREKHRGIRHASAYIAISENTASDLIKFFPDISLEQVTVAHCGVSKQFSPAISQEIESFKTKYGISKPFFLLVGGGSDYKNSVLFFQAFAKLSTRQGFEILCIGSGSILEIDFRTYTSGSVVHVLRLSDEELRIAYSGAIALIYPSKYEGFGLPVAEAMACGCPVISCPNGSIPEVAGEVAIYVNDSDVDGLSDALCEVQKQKVRQSLIASGLEQAKKFSWSKMAQLVSAALLEASLLRLNLKDINLIIFPDWSQPEESLSLELADVVKALMSHPDKSKINLLIDVSNTFEEDANLALSSIVINLLMEEDLDISDGPEIVLISQLSPLQWETLVTRIYARILMKNEDFKTLTFLKVANIPAIAVDSLNELK
jgi:glycosyltransferase involved in cell wall biosynthesis